MVSYTPTLGAVLDARKALATVNFPWAKMLVASVSQAPNWPAIPFAKEEARLVQQACSSKINVEVLGDDARGIACIPTVAEVKERLQDINILHLSCHGYQHPTDPLSSGFVLQDGTLTLSDLMSLQLDKAFFVFLGACDTAKGDKSQPDESLHLAAAMFFAGFRSVIGTMWYVLPL